MAMTIDQRQGGGPPPRGNVPADQSTVLRRVIDLQSVIRRLKTTRSSLVAEGGLTDDVDRIIDILACTLELIRSYHGDLEDDEAEAHAAASAPLTS